MTAVSLTEGARPRDKQAGASFRAARRAAVLRRRRKVRLAGAAFLALLALICAWLVQLRLKPDPVFLTLALTEYDPLPVNPFAQQDSDALLGHFARGSNAFASQQRGGLQEKLEPLQNVSDRDAVVVHLCAHAWADASEVYLPATDPATAPLRLSDVLAKLATCPARHKLLLLDVMRPFADPRRGVLIDDVAERVGQLVKQTLEKQSLDRHDDKSLLVLTACSDGQSSLTSEELGKSVFAYYLDRGLRGEADGYLGGSRNGRVEARELAAFVRDRVDRWAWLNRGLRQAPRLLPEDGADFPLTVCARKPEREEEVETAAPIYHEGLRAAWATRDALSAEAAAFLPCHLQRAEAALLQAEQQWRGGARRGLGVVNLRLSDPPDGLGPQLERVRASLPRPRVPPSLALAERWDPPAPDEPVAEAANRLVAELDRVAAAGAEKAVADFRQAVDKKPRGSVIRAVLEALARDGNPGPDTVAALDRLLTPLPPEPAPEYAETVFLRRLAALRERPGRKDDWPAATVALALKATLAGEKAVSADPWGRGLDRVRSRLEAAADSRRRAEGELFRRAAVGRDAASWFAEARSEYEKQEKFQREFAAAWRAYEQLLALLSDAVPVFARPERFKLWRSAADKVQEAGDLLAADSLSAEQLAVLAADLRGHREVLAAPFQAPAVKPDARSEDRAARVREVDSLLQSPYLRAEERKKLWQEGRQLARDLHEETRKLDRANDPGRQPGQPPGGGGPNDERRRAACRAAMSIQLASLAGLPPEDADRLGRKLDEASRDLSKRDAAWDEVARGLRGAWDDLLARTDAFPPGAPPDRKVLLAADRRNRILGAAGGSNARLPSYKDDPTFGARRRQARDYWDWLAGCCEAEARAVKAPDGAADFYRRAAREYREAADAYSAEPQ